MILEKHAQKTGKQKWAKNLDLAEMMSEFAKAVRSEVSYLTEGHNCQRFRDFFADDDTTAFPFVDFDLSTDRVLVMERMNGIPLNKGQKLADANVDTSLVVKRGATSYFRQIFELGSFHSDPHPGNLLAMPQNVVGFLDFGRVSSISERDRNLAAQLFVALAQEDEVQAADVVAEICRSGPELDIQGLRQDMSSIIGKYSSGGVGDVDSAAAMNDLLDMIRVRGLRMPAEFTMLFNTLGVLQGVVLQLDPGLNLTEVGVPYAKKIIEEHLSPHNLMNLALRTIARNLRVLDRLPVQVGDIMSALSTGQFKVVVSIEKQDDFMERAQAIVNRASIVFLLSALAIALAIASNSMVDNTLLSSIARVLLFAILLAGAWLFFSVMRHDWRMGKRRRDS
jgi:ubiquinone biosynthesis protein